MLKKLMHKLFLSCLKATELIEKKFRVRLSFRERIQLSMHKMMCDACTHYEKHSMLIEKGIGIHGKKIYYELDIDELKKLVHKKLERQGN